MALKISFPSKHLLMLDEVGLITNVMLNLTPQNTQAQTFLGRWKIQVWAEQFSNVNKYQWAKWNEADPWWGISKLWGKRVYTSNCIQSKSADFPVWDYAELMAVWMIWCCGLWIAVNSGFKIPVILNTSRFEGVLSKFIGFVYWSELCCCFGSFEGVGAGKFIPAKMPWKTVPRFEWLRGLEPKSHQQSHSAWVGRAITTSDAATR